MKTEMKYQHILKTDSDVFQAMLEGRKTFEIRFNDRDFHEGDTLLLKETKNSGEAMKHGLPLEYTGRELTRRVMYILHGPVYGLADGWVIMSVLYA